MPLCQITDFLSWFTVLFRIILKMFEVKLEVQHSCKILNLKKVMAQFTKLFNYTSAKQIQWKIQITQIYATSCIIQFRT